MYRFKGMGSPMQVASPHEGRPSNMSSWQRLLGISLRPWSGHSPTGLLIRGAIQIVVFGILIYAIANLLSGNDESAPVEQLAPLGGLAIMMIIVFSLTLLRALALIVVGGLDLFPRQTVSGTVVSMHSRRVGDFLPTFVQHQIFARRNSNGIDPRKTRFEVVLATPEGHRQWTVRHSRIRNQLREGAHVRLEVSPLVGYVARVHPA